MRKIITVLSLVCLFALGATAGESEMLKKVERKWSARFEMSDWNVDVRAVSRAELNKVCRTEHCLGHSTWILPLERGVILVLKASEYPEDVKADLRKRRVSIAADQRNTVVHEILHCVWAFMDEEYAIEFIVKWMKP